MAKVTRRTVIANEQGLHARPAMRFVDVANQFKSTITVYNEGEDPCDADGKSIMKMLTLAAVKGITLRIEAEGEDAEQAVAQLVELVESKFGEE